MVRVLLAVGFLLMTALAGCADDKDDGGGSDTTSTTGTQQADECPTTTATSKVPGFTAHGGQWGLELGSGDPFICGEATGSVQSLTQDVGTFGDLELTVTMTMLAGEFGLTESNLDKGQAGAGVVVHFKDEKNFNIVRYSPREQGWHLFTMIDGNRQKRDEGSVTPPTTNPEYGTAVELRVLSDGGRITAYDGTTKVIDYVLPAGASTEGQAGLFLRDAGMVTSFKDFHVRAA